LLKLERDLEALIADSRRSGGWFAWIGWAEHRWEAAHARKALVQSTHAFRRLITEPGETLEASESREIFEQNMQVAGALLDGGTRTRAPVSAAVPDLPSGGDEVLPRAMMAFVLVEMVLIAGGAWYWRRRAR
jgi:hypothetical protein